MDFIVKDSCRKCTCAFTPTTGFLNNAETVELKCANGHLYTAFLTAPKFVLYFEKGVEALSRNYYYEGYSWIYTSLELFRKDFVKAHLSIINDVPIDLIDQTFDKQFKKSENIYGAYAFAYLSYFNKTVDSTESPYPIRSNKEVQRRNNMFHAGKLPSVDDIKKDCFRIYQHMFHTYQKYVDSPDNNPASIFMLYYGNRYTSWRSSIKMENKNVINKDITLFNFDLNTFQYGTVFPDDQIPYSSFNELILEFKQRENIYNTKE